MRPPCEQHGHVIYGRAQVEVYVLQTRGSSLYLGEVQDVVEDHHQVLTRAPHGLGVLALVLIESGIQEEVRHAYNAVHGGSYLVAHVGYELALGPVGLLRPLPGFPQLPLVLPERFLGTLALRDIDHEPLPVTGAAYLILDHDRFVTHPYCVPITVDHAVLRREHFAGLDGMLVLGLHPPAVLRVHHTPPEIRVLAIIG